jgi:hypothetical protein
MRVFIFLFLVAVLADDQSACLTGTQTDNFKITVSESDTSEAQSELATVTKNIKNDANCKVTSVTLCPNGGTWITQIIGSTYSLYSNVNTLTANDVAFKNCIHGHFPAQVINHDTSQPLSGGEIAAIVICGLLFIILSPLILKAWCQQRERNFNNSTIGQMVNAQNSV